MNKKLFSTYMTLFTLFLMVSTTVAGPLQSVTQVDPVVTDRQSLLFVEEEEPINTAEIIAVEGVVDAISGSSWTVAGMQFTTNEYSYIDSSLAVGDEAFVLAEVSETETIALVIVSC